MSEQKKVAVCFQVTQPHPGYVVRAEVGQARTELGAFDYPRDRGMPAVDALESYCDFPLDGFEIIDSI